MEPECDESLTSPRAITRLRENAWSEFVPFLDYDLEIRRVIARRTRSSR